MSDIDSIHPLPGIRALIDMNLEISVDRLTGYLAA